MKNLTNQNDLTQALKEKAMEQGFYPVGVAKVPGSKRIQLRTEALSRWLKANHHADMKWMETSKRKDISQLLDGVSSVVAVGLNYHTQNKNKNEDLFIGRYAWGKDYHKVVKKRLKQVGLWLSEQRPKCKWKICVDTSPLLDKAWAEEAGIGWIGKNSNLINQSRGSWMAIGHLLCTEKLTPDAPAKSLCGSCEICINGCPTQAITEPFVIDSKKCIAYHTIENRSALLPIEITQKMDKWIAGCDICQEICPWNQKPIPSSTDPELLPQDWIMDITAKEALSWDDRKWEKMLQGSALKRIKPWMWRRNVLSTQNNSLT